MGLGRTLNEMLDRLGEAIEHERAFVADVGHELRTPLAILKAELELALAAGRSPQQLRAALASADEEADRAAAGGARLRRRGGGPDRPTLRGPADDRPDRAG